jgi:UDP-N-acetylglucosamine diphosphorylase/glucosamine-1-phosphate N-acetyltransferase
MPDISLILFDDARAGRWAPFALTRPVGELLFGTMTLRERAERVFGARCTMHLCADHLAGFEEPDAPPVAACQEAPDAGDRLFWLSRAVPDWGAGEMISFEAAVPGAIRIEDHIVGWFAPAGTPPPPPDFLRDPERGGPAAAVLPGTVLEHVWDLVRANPGQIVRDVAALHPDPEPPTLEDGVLRWGEHPIILGEGARVEPGSVLDTTRGPIQLAERAIVRAFTRLSGPAFVGRDSVVLGGTVTEVSLGPVCRVRGELAESVCVGYVNKQHDGHIGHAYLGRWVNLGAGTTNSDLKNNYGTVRLWTPEGETDTGELKMGCLLGDHVKTGIGLLLNTGTVVGAGSNLYGAAMPPKHVPPFSWGTGEDLAPYRLEKFLEVVERAMARREIALGEGPRGQLARAWRSARAAGEPGQGQEGQERS